MNYLEEEQMSKAAQDAKTHGSTPQKQPQFDDDDTPWLFNKSNLVWLVICLIFAGAIGFLQYRIKMIQNQDNAQVKMMHKWQSKVDALVSKNNRVIYLPKSGDLQLTKTQEASVTQLTELFSRITDFNSSTGYGTAYRYAKSIVKDQGFFQNYLTNPVDSNGQSVVDGTNLKFRNIRTQVLVTGKDTYTVIVTYVPYHSHSDLYQQSKLETQSQIFYLQGTPGNWTKCQVASDMEPNTTIYRVHDIEQ